MDLHQDQFGFIPNRRCSDHAAVIRNIILKHHKFKNSGELYVAVFDFSKAFDSCDTPTLLKALQKQNVPKYITMVIKSIYNKPKSKIDMNGKYGETFNIERGVAQGCTLSTLLFNIYIH